MSNASLTAVNAGMAASASAAAHRAKVERCIGTIEDFDSRDPTVAEMQSYADCVETVHPQNLSDGGVIVLKVLFVIALLSAGFFGAVQFRKDGDLFFAIVTALLAGLLIPAGLILACGVVLGIGWVFS